MRRSEQLAAGAGERLPNMCALLLPTSRHADVADTLINPTVPTYAIFSVHLTVLDHDIATRIEGFCLSVHHVLVFCPDE